MTKRNELVLGSVAVILVLAALALAFGQLGSPERQRAIRADEGRIDDLRAIQMHIWLRHLQLPATLADLQEPAQVNIRDPVTNAPYEYHPKSGTVYELCATFTTASTRTSYWSHPQGRQCFELDAAKPVPY